VFSGLKQHLTGNDILVPEKYGFHKDASIQTAVFSLTDIVHKAWNDKEHVVGIFYDLTKAFDCVTHDILIQKLKMCGVKGHILKWLEPYLNNRMQRVVLHTYNSTTTVSEWKAVRFGVPQ
jgi:hypothetical protein